MDLANDIRSGQFAIGANGPNVRTDEQVLRMREPTMRKSARMTASLRKQTKSYCASGGCVVAKSPLWVPSGHKRTMVAA